MTEHTAKPWRAGFDERDDWYQWRVYDDQGHVIANIVPRGAMKANAHLIAAAADLLEAHEAFEDANHWEEAWMVEPRTKESIVEIRMPIYERWAPMIETADCPRFNDAEQLRRLGRKLREEAVAKAKGKR